MFGFLSYLFVFVFWVLIWCISLCSLGFHIGCCTCAQHEIHPRSVDRPVDRHAQDGAQLQFGRPSGLLTARAKFLLSVDRPTGTSPDFVGVRSTEEEGSVDQSGRLAVGSACPIRIRTPFLIRSQIQLRFPKTLGLSAYK